MKLNHFGKLRKENGKLVYINSSDNAAYSSFKDMLAEGSTVEIFMEEVHDNGTLAQLAKVHAMIRELSRYTGIAFSDLKLLVKEQAGLCLSRTVAGKEYFLCKSFGECDRDELSAAIQACIEIGSKVGNEIS